MSELKPCFCGRPIDDVLIYDYDAGQGCKYAYVAGNCCGEWMIEFRTDYHPLNSEECKQLAIAAWNNAPRATDRDVVIE